MLKYYISDHGEDLDDAREIGHRARSGFKKYQQDHAIDESNPEIYAESAAEYCRDFEDGWEWDWPVVFVVIEIDEATGKAEELGRYEVSRHITDYFSASSIKS